jgi:hypothetical protein
MSLTNEQRAHDVALKFTELKFKQTDEINRLTGESSKFSFYETYLVAYEEILKKLNS